MHLFRDLQDKNIIRRVCEVFYEKVYEDPWISLYFTGIDQEFITQQQTDLIVGFVGGPRTFQGRLPSSAHPHMMIDDELFDLRTELLRQSLEEVGAPAELCEAWFRIDEGFRDTIVKTSVSQCRGRTATDPILDFENPNIGLKNPKSA